MIQELATIQLNELTFPGLPPGSVLHISRAAGPGYEGQAKGLRPYPPLLPADHHDKPKQSAAAARLQAAGYFSTRAKAA